MMRCHYEVLEVNINSSDDDIRKSYRKLALKWHPDKNLTNPEEAKEQFQLIQQAYEVLSDSQERAWYDKHRESILRGGLGSNYRDDCLNVYEYFTTSCFKGFGDDPKSFYSVYGEVFKSIAAEDSEFDKDLDSDFEIPVFGDSVSSYDDVVHLFYSHWQSYSTKKSFSWLDVYDTRQAPNRKILRLMEKENKKVRDKARKERNEEVRALVAFVRKRDKRVIEHIKLLEQQAVEKEKKSLEVRRQQIIKRQKEVSSYVESEWSKFSNLETELKEIEKSLAAEFQDVDSDHSSSFEDDDLATYENLYCVACNKVFKTPRAFSNHEKSKKHRENIEIIKAEMLESEDEVEPSIDEDTLDTVESDNAETSAESELSNEDSDIEVFRSVKKKKQKNKKQFMIPPESDISDADLGRNSAAGVFMNEDVAKPCKKKKKNRKENMDDNLPTDNSGKDNSTSVFEDVKQDCSKSDDKKQVAEGSLDSSEGLFLLGNQGKRRNRKIKDDEKFISKNKKKNKKKDAKLKEEPPEEKKDMVADDNSKDINGLNKIDETQEVECEVCKSKFKSKNILFKHLKDTGHAVPLTKGGKSNEGGKGKKKLRK